MNQYTVMPIGTIINNGTQCAVQLDEKYRLGLKELNGFSHLCLIWWFSDCDNDTCRSVIDCASPYVESPKVMGIFATRAPMRPNPIALSIVEILSINLDEGLITLAYTDANDGTPVLDLKPYTPSMDRIETPKVPNWCQKWPKSYEASAEFDWASVFNF